MRKLGLGKLVVAASAVVWGLIWAVALSPLVSCSPTPPARDVYEVEFVDGREPVRIQAHDVAWKGGTCVELTARRAPCTTCSTLESYVVFTACGVVSVGLVNPPAEAPAKGGL